VIEIRSVFTQNVAKHISTRLVNLSSLEARKKKRTVSKDSSRL